MNETGVRFREYHVQPALAPFVKCIWSQESDQQVFDASRERILPDSCVELVFHFRDPFRTHFADGTNDLQPHCFVVGQMKRFLEIVPEGRMGLIAIRFYARSAYLFFQRPLSEVAAGIVDLEDIWQDRAHELSERIALAGNMAARVRLIEETLLALLSQNGRYDRTVDRCLQLLETNCGQLNVAQLAADLGVSNRQLTRRFQHAVGLSPKEFSRVSRFLQALRCLSGRQHSSLTEVALACGYFDQAHFNHEFREMAGMTPGELFTFPNVAF
ncbi:MAG: helix-turn-helix domain-containing protein [Pyrinomonadaceae bacterium]|nr:helix-turn-helix domain-containing protein [Pyrinomonadaceae bacterium]